MHSDKQKKIKMAHGLMIILLFLWGFEYVAAKYALEAFPSLTLVFIKYLIGAIFMIGFKLKLDPGVWVKKKDIPVLVVCAITGEILYFFSEYEAMNYMPVSLITIMLAFVPAVSLIIEKIIYKKNPNSKMIAGVFLSIVGIAFIIGVDVDELANGRAIGYILCLVAVLSWNAYNFFTASLAEKYTGITLTLNQLICTLLLILPYAVTHLPKVSDLNSQIIIGVAYLGIVSAGIGFFIYVWALHILGPTTNAVYSNFLPVTTTIFGFLVLGELIGWIQVVGGIIVISAGYLIIREKGKLEEQSND